MYRHLIGMLANDAISENWEKITTARESSSFCSQVIGTVTFTSTT